MSIEVNATEQLITVNATETSIDVNVTNQVVDVNASTSVIEVDVSNGPGPQGPQGPAGQGVPVGGTANQVLAKNSSTNYDTKWVDAGVGSVTSVNASGSVGISVTGGPITSAGTLTITNTAPDQIVSLTASGGTVITGTYPNFTIYSDETSGYVPYTGATQNVDLGEYELKAGQLTLDVSPTGTAAVGTTRWNNTIGSSETTLKGGNVILKNGVDLVARIVNKVTPNQTLTKAAYQAVRVSGAQGQRLAVALAQANNDNNSADTIGLVTETIATNQEGFIITVGQLENINTTGSLQGETWSDGDVIYLSPTTAGALTNVKPVAPQHIIIIGYVEYAHQNNGKLYVKVMNGWELGELHDVTTAGATNGQVLAYNSSLGIWQPTTNGSGTVSSVNLTAGTGISVSGGPITSSGSINVVNTAPDQVVSLTGAGTTSISGTYPSFTITSNDQYTGTVTSVNMTVPTGFTISGNPITGSGTLALSMATGYAIPTTASQATWDSAYNDKINSASVTGTTTKTLTLTQQDGGTITTSWTDYDTAPVTSVFGRTGTVTAQSGDYSTTLVTEGTNLYFTDARARAAITLTTTGSSGSATYVGGTLNIPTYTLAGLGGVPTSRSLTINGTSYDLSADRSWSVGTVTSVDLSVPTGFAITGNPITSSGTLALAFATGYSLPTNASQTNWDAAYNDKINSASVTGTTTKTLTLNQQDGGTITASWTDINTDAVTSVFGRTGAVVAASGDYTTTQVNEGTNLYYTEARVSANTDVAANTAARHSAVTLGTANGLSLVGQALSLGTSSSTTTGALSSTDWTTFNSKQAALNGTGFVKISGTTISYDNSTYYLASNPSNYITLTSLSGTSPISYNNTTGAISISQASGTTNGFLSSTDWTTFNNKQSALTNPVTGTGTTNYLPKFTGSTTIGNSQVFDNGTNVGIGTSSPNALLTLDSGEPRFRMNIAGVSQIILNHDGSSAVLRTESNTPFIFGTNGSERMRLTSTGLGIGTTSPSEKLHVNGSNGAILITGTTNTSGFKLSVREDGQDVQMISQGSGGGIRFLVNGGTEAMRLTSSGNLGLGVTPSSWISSAKAFQLGNTASLFAPSSEAILGNNIYVNSSDTNIYLTTNFATQYRQVNGQHIFYTAPSGTAGNAISFTQAMTLDASGRLLVNRTSSTNSSYYIQSTGGISTSTSLLAQGSLNGYSGAGIFMSYESYGGRIESYDYGTSAWKNIAIAPNGGSIGIGTSSPSQKFEVNGASNFLSHVYIGDADIIFGYYGRGVQLSKYNVGAKYAINTDINQNLLINNSASGFENVLIYSAGSERLRITSGGNVGIGTTSASYKLQVYNGSNGTSAAFGGTEYGVRIDNGGTFSSGRSTIYGVNSTFYGSYQPLAIGASILYFSTYGTDRAVIDDSGNMGIGTTSPSNKLHVVGTSQISSYTGIGVAPDSSTMVLVKGTSTSSANFAAVFQNSAGTNLVRFFNNGKVNFGALPTSSAGLSSGDLWNDGGTLKIV